MRASNWVYVLGAGAVVASLAVWAATGAEGFTRWPNQRLEQSDAPPAPGESELLEEAGFSGGAEEAPPDIQSRFALGLLPSGADAAHALSVASIVGVVVAACVVASVAGRRCGACGACGRVKSVQPGQQ